MCHSYLNRLTVYGRLSVLMSRGSDERQFHNEETSVDLIVLRYGTVTPVVTIATLMHSILHRRCSHRPCYIFTCFLFNQALTEHCSDLPPAPLKLRPYGAIEIRLLVFYTNNSNEQSGCR